ncbi:hypothetical protein O181_083212 [Austropuccinia psidii MF-1]|uniref:Secreted protein n=1 Tax=Austropuccinia psidii MF-1 TaxID=1389203 RepID=A0A9Q3FU01_9BASI|nr:hypothetical protein [Austropuccinia psidii MF-1]
MFGISILLIVLLTTQSTSIPLPALVSSTGSEILHNNPLINHHNNIQKESNLNFGISNSLYNDNQRQITSLPIQLESNHGLLLLLEPDLTHPKIKTSPPLSPSTPTLKPSPKSFQPLISQYYQEKSLIGSSKNELLKGHHTSHKIEPLQGHDSNHQSESPQGHDSSHENESHDSSYENESHHSSHENESHDSSYENESHHSSHESQSHDSSYESQSHHSSYENESHHSSYESESHDSTQEIKPLQDNDTSHQSESLQGHDSSHEQQGNVRSHEKTLPEKNGLSIHSSGLSHHELEPARLPGVLDETPSATALSDNLPLSPESLAMIPDIVFERKLQATFVHSLILSLTNSNIQSTEHQKNAALALGKLLGDFNQLSWQVTAGIIRKNLLKCIADTTLIQAAKVVNIAPQQILKKTIDEIIIELSNMKHKQVNHLEDCKALLESIRYHGNFLIWMSIAFNSQSQEILAENLIHLSHSLQELYSQTAIETAKAPQTKIPLDTLIFDRVAEIILLSEGAPNPFKEQVLNRILTILSSELNGAPKLRTGHIHQKR